MSILMNWPFCRKLPESFTLCADLSAAKASDSRLAADGVLRAPTDGPGRGPVAPLVPQATRPKRAPLARIAIRTRTRILILLSDSLLSDSVFGLAAASGP